MNGVVKALLGGVGEFAKTFRQNEYRSIARRGGAPTLVWLSLIVGATLAALAFAAGSLDQLRERMDNPFTNIVDKGIYRGDRDAFERVRREILADEELRGRMGLDTITDWSVYVLNVFPAGAQLVEDAQPTRPLRGRTVNYSSTLFNFVFTPYNVLYGRDFAMGDPEAANSFPTGGIIIKASVLKALGYSQNELAEVATVPIYQNSLDAVVQLPIHAIVRDLPSNADFVSSKDFYLSITGEGCINESFSYNKEGDNNLRFAVDGESEEDFVEAANVILAGPDADLEINREPLASDGKRELTLINLNVRFPYVRARDAYYAELRRQLSEAVPNGWVPYVRYARTDKACRSRGAQQASFVFTRLDDIRDFRKYLLDRSGIDLPIEVVENKENFAMVSLLGVSIGFMLLLFSLASICFFIRNLIEGHLNDIKPNLGTFKAFGMPNEALVRHYQRIISVLLLSSIVLGFAKAGLAGLIIRFIGGPGRFALFSPWVLLSLVLIALFAAIFARRVVRKILSRTPGDLVYGRS